MTSIFTAILNMSITASYVVVGVIVLRILFKKIPKVFSYALWLPVLIRLVFPYSFTSNFSFLSFLKSNAQSGTGAMEYVPNQIGLMNNPAIDIGIQRVNNSVNTTLQPAVAAASVNSMQIVMEIASIIWVVGIAVMLIYSVRSYVKVLIHVRTATLVKDNIFETDRISTPFVCGFIKPRIFIPAGMNPNELSYILAHEQTHIQRLDYLIKPFAFLVLVLHWFNPFIWLSFALMSKDMEMSCDERVLKKLGNDIKGNYSNSLLTLAVGKNNLVKGSPLAFGESNIKARIKNVLHYKKPTHLVLVSTFIITLIFSTGFISNPAVKEDLSFLNTETDQNLKLSSIYGEFQMDGDQVTNLFDVEKWNRQNVPSPKEQSTSITIKSTSKPYDEIRFYNSDHSLAMIIHSGEYRYYKIPESEYDLVYELVLATVWADGLQTRDGQPRYEMMSEEMKEKFKQEQIVRSGENWNFNIGVSSPWVVDFEVEIYGTTANITYLTKTSVPAYYSMMETITFGKENGTLVVKTYHEELAQSERAHRWQR
jgi:beta-lactamase regulating signal transducer with metallopeptidase domain